MPRAGAPPIADDKARGVLTPEAKSLLGKLAAALEADAANWGEKQVEDAVRRFAESMGVKLGQVAQPLRCSPLRLDSVTWHLRGGGDPGSRRNARTIAGCSRIDGCPGYAQGRFMTARVWAWLLSLSVLWGGSFFFAKVALGELAPLVGGVRSCGTCCLRPATSCWSLTAGSLFQRKVPWRSFFAMGLLNNLVPFALIFWGQSQIASGLASILNATTPLFTLVVAHFLTQRRTDRRDQTRRSGDRHWRRRRAHGAGRTGRVTACWASLPASAPRSFYAFAGVYGRRFKTMGVAPLDAAAGQVTASTMLILPIDADRSISPGRCRLFHATTVWASLAGLALLSTALAYVLYFRILAAAGATNLLLVTFLIPVTAILLGVAVLGEHLLPRHFAGMALIGLSLAAIDGRLLKFPAYREIAAGLHNCALRRGLLEVPPNRRAAPAVRSRLA